MSHTPTGRRFRHHEFTLPSGKKIIAGLPLDIPALHRQYSGVNGPGSSPDVDFEVVTHGSDEHITYLREVHSHHEGRREEIRARFGDAVSEWEETHRQLQSVSSELEKILQRDRALDHNYGKFGYSKGVRTYDGGMPGGGGDGGGGGELGTKTELSGVSTPGDAEAGTGQGHHYHGSGATTTLFKRPVVRQWFHRGVIWRAAGQTEIMAIELFFDLLYVGIIHSNGEHMAEDPTGQELLRFAITFIMSWKIWTEITSALSWFESDDVFTKVEVLFNLACLLAFTTNMISSFNEDPAHNTYAQLVGFYLATRFVTAFHFGVNYFLLPMVRGVMLASCIQVLIPTALWIGSIYVEMPDRLALIWIAIALDMWGQIFYFAPVQYILQYRKEAADTPFTKAVRSMFDYLPAVNIEHRVERTNAFVSLVLGYSVVGILFQSNGGYNINAFLGKAVIGLLQAFFFNWIYFDIDGSGIEQHAIRRSGLAMTIWNNAHLPFIMAYIIATSALSRLVLASDMSNTHPEQLTENYRGLAEEEFGAGVRYFYCHGLAIALLSMTAIALSHSHFSEGRRLAKKYRLANRVAMALIMFFLPLATSLKSLHLISITFGLISWVLIVELWGVSLKGCSCFGEVDCTRKAFHGSKEEDDAKLPTVT